MRNRRAKDMKLHSDAHSSFSEGVGTNKPKRSTSMTALTQSQKEKKNGDF